MLKGAHVVGSDSIGTSAGCDGRLGGRPNELRALSALAFEDLARFPSGIRDMHLGIAERAFRRVGVASRPVQLIHHAVSRRAYGVIASGASLLGQAVDTAMAQRGIGEEIVLSTTRRGSALLAALSGLIGDQLEYSGSDLHQPVSVRVRGKALALDSVSMASAFPDATSRLVVFLHGLMGNEFYWDWGGAHPGDNYGARLAADARCTPVYLRYNTGLHVSENGRSVASLLEELVAAWPVEVREIALVGHSMGGLIARSACVQASEGGQSWTRCVRHVISLGTPHLGAPLEQGAHVAAEALYALPETRMLGAFLRRRSAGIRDLRHGSLVDEDWRGRDPNALRAAACKEVPLLPGATHCFVSATITRSPHHPLGRLFGDTLVLVPSATGQGRTRRIPFQAEYGHHVSPAHHLALLNHPEVYVRLRDWLRERDPGAEIRVLRELAPSQIGAATDGAMTGPAGRPDR
jgi:pimeloyl-ACP methyl ester carboxylesterase